MLGFQIWGWLGSEKGHHSPFPVWGRRTWPQIFQNSTLKSVLFGLETVHFWFNGLYKCTLRESSFSSKHPLKYEDGPPAVTAACLSVFYKFYKWPLKRISQPPLTTSPLLETIATEEEWTNHTCCIKKTALHHTLPRQPLAMFDQYQHYSC